MQMQQDISLREHSTMRLGGKAAYATEVTSRQEVEEAVGWAEERKLPIMMIGGGSNIIWKDEGFSGLLVVNKIMGFEEEQEDAENYYVTVGAGENWDSVVARTAAKGMTGIESLSLIPGTAGATPVQNVGAYGQEISQVLVSVEAYDLKNHQFATIPNSECQFSYRKSRFNSGDRGRFLITHITLHLLKGNIQPPLYSALQTYLDERNSTDYSPAAIRKAVIDIRSSKLPDPAKVANNGSFFANPIISEDELKQLQLNYPSVPHWPAGPGKVKIPAAWLVEKAGFKDFHDPETGMATWQRQPLVFVNEKAQTTAQLMAFRQKVLDAVQRNFGIVLVQEPELLP